MALNQQLEDVLLRRNSFADDDDDGSGPRRLLRELQPSIPDYTSPPLDDAVAATPEAYRDDDVIGAFRTMAAAGNCTTGSSTTDRCHIPFVPPSDSFDQPGTVGVILYCGGLVDPRSYAPLARRLADRYGLPVVIPVFDADVALSFGVCDSGRLRLAQAEFTNVAKWVLVGHSLGGLAAMVDAWTYRDDPTVGGLAMLASYLNDGLGCGESDFSTTSLPMAGVTASNDLIINQTNAELYKPLYSNETLFVDVYGGNHALFGSYDDSERKPLLGQVDGEPIIPPAVQWDLTVAAIFHVASRTGVDLPQKLEGAQCPPDTSAAVSLGSSW
eukprot:CAMPEP_0178686194 /NCGR_PEP_ID=MMETSP0699-20121125/3791_1 /TAXON_ID=265572 /ORGANISM="Extubocellulus spinifer, Strain CCMP396" /LENGTH=327 /DNA_ID=CAMNT_0020331007 /DNA_START=27 /DNA_END=1007 /DNA_ORIENTATION=+